MHRAPFGDQGTIKIGVKHFQLFPVPGIPVLDCITLIAVCFRSYRQLIDSNDQKVQCAIQKATWKRRANVFHTKNVFLFLKRVLITVLLRLGSGSINRHTELKTATISLWEKRILRLRTLSELYDAKRLIGYSNGSVGDLLTNWIYCWVTHTPVQLMTSYYYSFLY